MDLLVLVQRSHLVEEEQAEQFGVQPLSGRTIDDRRFGKGHQPESGMDSQDAALAHFLVGSAVCFLDLVVAIGTHEPLTIVQLQLSIVDQSASRSGDHLSQSADNRAGRGGNGDYLCNTANVLE